MAVYDDQKTKIEDDELRKITGKSKDEEKKMEENAVHNGGVAEDSEKEGLGLSNSDDKKPGDKSGDISDSDEQNKGGGLYRDEGQRRFRFSLTKKQGIIGGIIGLIVAGGFGVTSFMTGPLQAIHKAKLLGGFHLTSSEIFHDDRSAKFFLYALSGKAAKGRLGFISNSVADRVELRLNNDVGIKSVYHPDTGRLVGYQILDPNKADAFLNDLEADGIRRTNSISGIEATDINGKKLTGNREFVDLSDSKLKNRRSITRFATKSTDLNLVTSKLSSRLLIKRAGVNFHPLKPGRRGADDFFTWRRAVQNEKAREHATGERADLDNPNPDAPNPNEPIPGSTRSKLLERFRSLMNSAKGPAAAVALYCGLQGFSDGIDDINYENLQQSKRMGMNAITVGSQVMSNQDVNMEILGALNELNYDPVTDTTWAVDAGILAEQGKTGGVNYVEDLTPGSSDKPLFFDVVDKASIPGAGTVCSTFESVGEKVMSLPGVSHTATLLEAALNGALNAVGIPSTDELQKMALEYFAEGGVDVLARGAKRGGIENKGVRAAANDAFIAIGARELDETETIEAKAQTNAELAYRQSQLGAFDRYVNPYNPASAFGSMLTGTRLGIGSFFNSLFKLPASAASVLTSSYSDKVAAQTIYDYGFPLYGFTQAEMNSDLIQDPFENGEWIETGNRLEELNEEYGEECFGMTVTGTGDNSKLVYGESVDPAKIPDKCSGPEEELLRYRFYLADIVNAKSIACYEGVDESACTELGFGSGGVTGEINTGASSEYIPDCTVNDGNAEIACVAIDTMLGIPYKNGFTTTEGCLQSPSPSDAPNPVSALDCSAFTSMAVYRAFGTDAPRASVLYLTDPNFEVVGDTRSGSDTGNIRNIQPGDLIGRGECALSDGGSCSGHIGIVVSYDSTTNKLVTVETDSCGNESRIVTNKGLEIDSKGEYTWAVRYTGPK